VELSCGLAPVAVDAPNVALFDLGVHAGPGLVDDQSADLGELREPIAMVELEHDRIRDAAVNAGMAREVQEHFAAVPFTATLHLSDGLPDVVRLVRHVVGAPVGRVTLAAIEVQ